MPHTTTLPQSQSRITGLVDFVLNSLINCGDLASELEAKVFVENDTPFVVFCDYVVVSPSSIPGNFDVSIEMPGAHNKFKMLMRQGGVAEIVKGNMLQHSR